jgi:short-subunit dehydrogenase
VLSYRGQAALVTGASSGIGEAFARALAARSVDVLLTSLPADQARLEEIAKEISSRHGVRAEVVTLDLAERGGASRLQEAADKLGFEPDILVNSAGYGALGRFSDGPFDQQLGMIRINVEALVALTGLYLPRMVAKRQGSVINIASTVALFPVPYWAVYSASKAFVLSFSNALWAECRRQGIRIVAVCPGPVLTRFHERSSIAAPTHALEATAVVEAAFEALDRDRPAAILRVLPWGVAFALISAPIAPRRLRLLVAEKLARRLFRQR